MNCRWQLIHTICNSRIKKEGSPDLVGNLNCRWQLAREVWGQSSYLVGSLTCRWHLAIHNIRSGQVWWEVREVWVVFFLSGGKFKMSLAPCQG